MLTLLVLALLGLVAGAYVLGVKRALVVAGDPRRLHSLPEHYGAHMALWCGLPALN